MHAQRRDTQQHATQVLLTAILEQIQDRAGLFCFQCHLDLVPRPSDVLVVFWEVPNPCNDLRRFGQRLVLRDPARRFGKKWHDDEQIDGKDDLQGDGEDPLELTLGHVGSSKRNPGRQHEARVDIGALNGEKDPAILGLGDF